MLSIHEVKELLDDKTISDKEAEEIRDACHALASLIYDTWRIKNKRKPDDEGVDLAGAKDTHS